MAAPAVTTVTVRAEALAVTEAIVIVPDAGPFMSLFLKLWVAAVAAMAFVTSKPVGKVRTILPASGTDVETGNSTPKSDVAPADLFVGETRTGLIPCIPASCCGPLPGPSCPPVRVELATVP